MQNSQKQSDETVRAGGGQSSPESGQVSAPTVSLPKGGGAIRGIGEKFAANPVTGTGSMSVPIPTSLGRSGFGPQLSLAYDSGSGNGPFGFGWTLSIPFITRKTDKGLPLYRDTEDSDIFILSGAEDLVPVFKKDPNGNWILDANGNHVIDETEHNGYKVRRYRPRIEGLFARIERWTRKSDGDAHWRSISKDNITTLYGKTAESRIVDPADKLRVFSWLICESFDDKGNAIRYEYKAEDSKEIDLSQVHERNRDDDSRSANRYLKRIKYGNKTPRQPNEDLSQRTDWLFEVVLDYGEHYTENNQGQPTNVFLNDDQNLWLTRQDPFSAYRATFEVRTYRLCRRVLMFHHFPDELGAPDYLVRSTEFAYVANSIASFITAVTQSGFRRKNGGVYLKKSLPPLEFTYSQATIHEQVREVDSASLENLPYGLDGARYQWVDLDGEGLSGILTEQADGWFYKRNLSPVNVVQEGNKEVTLARFGAIETVASKPSLAALASGGQQFLDLAGDGELDLVELERPLAGFYERTEDSDWKPFRPFESCPNLAWNDPNLKFVDLTGDGHADVIITEHEAFTWYPSLAEAGFAPAEKVRQVFDEEKGPRLIFADGTQSIYLADLSGDGLSDLVRIRNGEVCYWPNLGYCRFGAKVTMDNAPWFDTPDQFDQRCIRLADIDGSGPTDIIYLGGKQIDIYRNQAGNSWRTNEPLIAFPRTDNLSSVQAVDLLGNGTACLVWSSPLPGDASRPMRYIDLMGGQKPHLLIKTVNNLGAETVVHYAPSTKFYLQDQLAGTPWITKLPFPVHVVERVETYDRISRNRFVMRHAYHHGYFDGDEREFRGFGMVEQWDTEEFAALSASDAFTNGENIDAASHVPPVHTKTWFHTGVYLGRDHVSNFFAGLLDGDDKGEYYREPGLDDEQAKELVLEDTLLPAELTIEEEREACRALKGSMLRQEVYALDGTDKAQHPYTVTEQNFTIQRLQSRADNRHGVFFTHAREAISNHSERNPADPRISHALTLEVDAFGNVLKSAAVGYGRRQEDLTLSTEDRAKQTQTLITYTENRVTNVIDTADGYRSPLPCETRTYELTGLALLVAHNRFTLAEMLTAGTGAAPIAYEQNPTLGVLQKRLIEHVRTLYRPDDLGLAQNDPLALLPLGTIEPLALPGESYKLAFTPGLLVGVYGGRVTDALLDAEGRYVHSGVDADWWIPSGRILLSPGSADTPAEELAQARAHFFLPRRYRDPFHTAAVSTESVVGYDPYDLLVVETRDALGNIVTAATADDAGSTAIRIDYRVLQPYWVTDPNGNRKRVAFDALGMVVGTAVMGKPLPAPVEGDSLEGFEADLTEAVVLDHLADPLADPQAILGRATTRLVYDLFAYQRTKNLPHPQPAAVYTLARETHDSDPVPAGGLKIQHSFSYSDGFGREIQKKMRAEPGPVPERDSNGNIIAGPDGQPQMTPNDVSPRWVGSGWTVFNNKGKPVRQYEPFFTDTHRFEFDVRIGVSPVLFYDPVERVVATLHPNHTWEKVVFDPWRQETWDVSDTVLVADPKIDPDIGDFFRRLPDADYLPTWHTRRQGGTLGPHEQAAARKAAIHAETPSVAHADSLGRTFLTVAHNKFKFSDTLPTDPPIEEFHRTRVIFDIEGNQREVIDAKDRVVMRYDYDMLGTRIHQASMEAGERWMLGDVAGTPIRAWDSRGHAFRTEYDPLRRPLRSLVQGADPQHPATVILFGKTDYGEGQPDDVQLNLRTKPFRQSDSAGLATSEAYDFKGNPLRSSRRLAQNYQTIPDWSANPGLEQETFTSRTSYDALNRPVQLIAPRSNQPGAKRNIIQLVYNEANLLEGVDVWLDRPTDPAGLLDTATVPSSPVGVDNIDYDAKGQRLRIDYKNGAATRYAYDPDTFRLVHLYTRRGATFTEDCENPLPPPATIAAPDAPPPDKPCGLQNLHYTYDPVGNITHIRDDAQQTLYFRNKRVEPIAEYTYDAIYRLIEATGREHLGQTGAVPSPSSYNDKPRVGIPFSASDGNVMGSYLERYVYDAVGNFQEMIHRGSDSVNPGWTRAYAYNEASLLDPGKQSNRLTSTTIGTTTETYSSGADGYDAHGNMLRMPHLHTMQWDFEDKLQLTQRQAVNATDEEGVQHQGERTYYVYDAGGQRVRKVTELATGQVKDERIYLGGFEIYHRHGANPLVRETLHIMDDQQRIALVETRTDTPEPAQLIRYQYDNHLGSASLELDDQGRVISYEEYTPYGNTSYQAVRSQTETPKRYRYTSKERDEETGFSYHGARYYAMWVGRWISCDPLTPHPLSLSSASLYSAFSLNPLVYVDPNGKEPKKPATGFFARIKARLREWIVVGAPLAFPDGPIKDKVREKVEETKSESKKDERNKNKPKPSGSPPSSDPPEPPKTPPTGNPPTPPDEGGGGGGKRGGDGPVNRWAGLRRTINPSSLAGVAVGIYTLAQGRLSTETVETFVTEYAVTRVATTIGAEALLGRAGWGVLGFLPTMCSDNAKFCQEQEVNKMIDERADSIWEKVGNWQMSHPPESDPWAGPRTNPWGVKNRAEARQLAISQLVAEQEKEEEKARQREKFEAQGGRLGPLLEQYPMPGR